MKEKCEIRTASGELILELSKILKTYNLDEWEIYLLKEEGLSVEVREQKIESFECEDNLSLALRMISGGRMGFGYSTYLKKGSLKKLVEGIFSRMKELDADVYPGFPKPFEQAPDLMEIYDDGFHKRNEREKVNQAMILERSAYEFDPMIKRVRECIYEESRIEVWINNSNGLFRNAKSSQFSLLVSAVAEQGEDAQIASEFDWSFQYDMLSPERVGRGAGEKAIAKLGGKPIPSIKAPVIINPEIAGEFMGLLSSAFSGENLVKDKTWLKGTEGEKIFSNVVSIIDDGLLTQGPDCFPFDGEGSVSKKKTLVENGIVRQFIFDSYYAYKLKKNTTSNAHREQIFFPPAVGPSNFYIKPGKKSPEQIISSLDFGLLIKEALGMHTSDVISGEFSVGVSGQWIKNGRISHPVSGVAIAGTLKELFGRVVEVGDDLKFFTNCASPTILIEEMEISGS